MRKSYREYKVVVKANFCSRYPISEHVAYTEEEDFSIARQQSALNPASQIIIEEWKVVYSPKRFKSGYYKGRTIYYSEVA